MVLDVLNPTQRKMVEDFQCPGCIFGPGPEDCSNFDPEADENGFACNGHRPGTMMSGAGLLYLGLPKGFCRVIYPGQLGPKEPRKIILHQTAETFSTDKFNVAVWAMERDGYLFVRVFMPRLDLSRVHVVKGGTLSLVPLAIDAGAFVDEMD